MSSQHSSLITTRSGFNLQASSPSSLVPKNEGNTEKGSSRSLPPASSSSANSSQPVHASTSGSVTTANHPPSQSSTTTALPSTSDTGTGSSSGSAPLQLPNLSGQSGNCTTSGVTGGPTSSIFSVGPPLNGDNTPHIQSLINQASSSGGGVVQLSSGTYEIDGHLSMKNNVTLNGAGMFATILQAGMGFMATNDNGGYPVIATDGANNATIENLEADQNASALYAADLVDNNTAGRLNEDIVYANYSTNVLVQHIATRSPFSYSLGAGSSSNFCFRYNNVQQDPAANGEFDQLDGIHILNSSFGDVLDNYVDQRAGGATDGDDGLVAHTLSSNATHDITYAGNVVRGGYNGHDMAIALTDSGPIYNLVIKDNEFYGGPVGIIGSVYSSTTDNLSSVSITGNIIHNRTAGSVYGTSYEAIDIGGPELGGTAPITSNTHIEGNYQCQDSDGGADGPFYAPTASGNVVSGNITYTDCSDQASFNPAQN